jgi:hypothetical protein
MRIAILSAFALCAAPLAGLVAQSANNNADHQEMTVNAGHYFRSPGVK